MDLFCYDCLFDAESFDMLKREFIIVFGAAKASIVMVGSQNLIVIFPCSELLIRALYLTEERDNVWVLIQCFEN